MRLNHLHLTVPNVAQSRAFFETYFGFRCIVSVSRSNGDLVVLTDEAGFALILNNFDKAPVEYPRGFHIGFMQDSRERVDEIYERLKSDGFGVESPREFHGAWTFFFRAPGGFDIEVLHQFRRGDAWEAVRSRPGGATMSGQSAANNA
ncbi:MAG: VOC family protein [Planctomycetaceae bacterium]|nr:VOC family protein [Planctomycetaceae bacterium]